MEAVFLKALMSSPCTFLPRIYISKEVTEACVGIFRGSRVQIKLWTSIFQTWEEASLFRKEPRPQLRAWQPS